MIRAKAQKSLFGTVALTLALALIVYFAYQISLGIPARVQVEQETLARDLLMRLGRSLSSADGPTDSFAVERLLAIEGQHPLILALAVLDERGRPPATGGDPTVAGLDRTALIELAPDLIRTARMSAMQPWLLVPEGTRQLVAAMGLAGLEVDASLGVDGSPASGGPVLYLVMDLEAGDRAERRRLLSLESLWPWVMVSVVSLGLGLLLGRSWPGPGFASEPVTSMVPSRRNGDRQAIVSAADLDPILDVAAVILVGWDAEGRVQLINQKGCDLLGLARDQVIGCDWVESFVPEREREMAGQILARLIADEADALIAVEGEIVCADGTERLIEWSNRPIRDPEGRVIGGLGSGMDITERKQAERALSYLVTLETVLVETSRSLVGAPADAVGPLVENALGTVARRMGAERAYVFVLSRDGKSMRNTQEWSASGLGLGGDDSPRVPTSLIPRWMETLQHGDDIRIDDVLKLPETWRADREQLEQLEVRAVAATAIRAGGRLSGFVAVEMLSGPRSWRDSEMRALGFLADLIGGAFERRRNELKLLDSRRRLEEMALYDPLTHLPNRRLLAERMDEAVVRSREQGFLLGVCYLDLDGFKPINDTHGHKMGDRVLVTVASRLRGCVREDDTVARLGGDEFALLMNHMDSLADCAALLERVLTSLAQPIQIDGQSLTVTCSAGVTLFPQDAVDVDTLLRHADHAMYQAKQQGRNRFQFFKSPAGLPDPAHRRELVRIRDAIEGDELRLQVQPWVEMRSGRVVGVEALVRWAHPERGLLPPGDFLPLLEGDELQQQLDWWVMDQALRLLMGWQEAGLDLTMSLNLSARSLQDKDFVASLQEALARHPSIEPSRLLVEIIESEALRDIETIASVIRACAVLGVRFALDGFGNGYASLIDFRCLPAQFVKIDQTVVRDILRSRDNRNLVEGVIGIAHAFERQVIAEGVESAVHGLLLMDLGCTLAQGYGIADPMPPERFPAWMASYRAPLLWERRPPVDWARDDLLLLSMEAVHRQWVNRLVRHVSTDTLSRMPELQPERCDFGRWYLGEGQERYGQLPAFQALDELHRRTHHQAQLLLETNRLDPDALADPVARLTGERDALVEGIRTLQAQVLQASP
jgi:diguanylate cyclase (GGDEF)-like protein/PAS domain S-box-containing protein